MIDDKRAIEILSNPSAFPIGEREEAMDHIKRQLLHLEDLESLLDDLELMPDAAYD